MFNFVIRYFGFFKFAPGAALLFDALLKLWTLIANPILLDWIDDIEKEVLTWPGTTLTTHKYGGLQFNYKGKELGHLHSNGLLDILLNRKMKSQLRHENTRVHHHHVFKGTGWISFYMKFNGDKELALKFLAIAYSMQATKLNLADSKANVEYA